MLPLETKFKLNSFVISHADGTTDTFDGSLSDAYASLNDGDSLAYSNLGKKYQGKSFMSWVPVIVDAENLHGIRPIIRKLSKEHGLAVGRLSPKQVVIVFPLDRNVPVAGSDTIDYQTIYQSLLSYFDGVMKNTAKEADVNLTVHRAPYLLTPSSESIHLVQDALGIARANVSLRQEIADDKHKNGGKRVAELQKAISDISTNPKLKQFKMMEKFLGNASDERTLEVSKAIHYSALTTSFFNGGNGAYRQRVNSETEHQLFLLVKAVYLYNHKNDKNAKNTLAEMGRTVERLNPYDGSWSTHFEELTQNPYEVYGLKKDWSLNFHDGYPWIVPTDTLMKMLRADISGIEKPQISMIMTGSDKDRHPKAGMTSNYQIEITDPRICGHALAYNRVSKQVVFLHAIDTRFVHARYEEKDPDGTVTAVDRHRAFPLTDAVIGQIRTGLEQIEGNVINKSSMLEAISTVARQNSYDPVSSYIDALPAWDGKERLKDMFINFLGVPNTSIMKHESEIFGIAPVYLGLNPGSKFDQLFDFIGTQGVGKTTFLMKYFNSFGAEGLDPSWPRDNFGWYLQGIRSFDQKDDNLAMSGMLCVNDDEMVASKKAGVETIKQIASAPFFKVRKPYDILPTTIERTFIMCRTSNLTQNQYKASHGQRKFVPFLVSKDRHTMDCAGPTSIMTPSFVDQCWAEAYAKYKQLKTDGKLVSFFSLSEDEEDDLKEARVSLQYIDDLKIDVIGFVNYMLKLKVTTHDKSPLSFTTDEVTKYITRDDRKNLTLARKLQPILTNDLDFKHTLVGKGRSRKSGYVATDKTKKDLDQLNADLKKM